MACEFTKFLLKWTIALECYAVTAQCHRHLPGVDIVEVRRYGTTNDKAHVHFPARQHVVAYASSAGSFAKKEMVSGGLTNFPSLEIHRGRDFLTISLQQRVSSGTFVRSHRQRRMNEEMNFK
jgi:hypothetical protein